jgi:hypothetical protein
MTEYTDIQTGAYGLLYDTTKLLNGLGVKYIVIGGWTPFLLNSTPILHPGTKDVDVLFDGAYEKGKLKEVITAFLENGFILSAKHEFQLFKSIKVSGQSFVYNVDLLHPLETIKPKDIYVEHIDLSIPADKYKSRTFKMKSIALPSSQSLFDSNLFISYDLTITTKDGSELKQKIPLMGELGTLITKSQSVSKDKRYRDSLDIYLTLKQSCDLTALIKSVNKLKETHIGTFNNLYGIRQAYDDKTLLSNTYRFLNDLEENEFKKTFENFFEKTGLNNEATN